jgi:hypothetical protein
MTLLLFYLDNRFFGLAHLLFYFLIFFNNRFENYTKLKIRLIILIFDSGLLS